MPSRPPGQGRPPRIQALAPADRPVRQVFVNATLRFDSIAALGFDMDYTVAMYNYTDLEELAFGYAVRTLQDLGYPPICRSLGYRPRRAIRGLVIDQLHGNVLKTDRYHHVSIALHGFRELAEAERRRLYPGSELQPGDGRFVCVDTLFSLPDVDLYCQLVALRDADPAAFHGRDYATLWKDVRHGVDLCHRSGALKRQVMEDPGRYLEADAELAPALLRLRRQGKQLFLLTNSEFYYTDRVMQHLLGGRTPGLAHWAGYFDLVVTEAGKPGYFTEAAGSVVEARVPLRDGGERLIWKGGHFQELEQRLGCRGNAVLFAGDHIYGDVIRSKKLCAWRTVFVIPELEDELLASERVRPEVARYFKLLHELEKLDRSRARLEARVDAAGAAGDEAVRREAAAAGRRAGGLQQELATLEARIDRSFHPQWGALLNDGGEVSRFGAQTETYADLYTARVANLARYPADKVFYSPWEGLHHSRVEFR